MNPVVKAVDRVLWFFGVRIRHSGNRSGKDPRAPISSQSLAPQSAPSGTGPYSSSADVRGLSEIEGYEQLAETLDTRVFKDRGWLACLSGVGQWQIMRQLDESDKKPAMLSVQLLNSRLFDFTSHLAAEYNDIGKQVVISMTPPSDVNERRKVNKGPGAETTETITYTRWRASTGSWALSCRTQRAVIELFLLPSSDLMALSQAEVPLRLKMRMELLKVSGRRVWTSDGLPISAEDLRSKLRMLFRDLVSATQEQEQPTQMGHGSGVDDPRLKRSIEQLVIEREHLAQKVVIQQEEIQKRIARDLHDAVISDVMALKRNLSSSSRISVHETMDALEVIVRKLREICYDLSPRDLSDWGLSTVIEDMLDQISQRTGIDCELICEMDIPVMPSAVLLHIYRIVQESVNNATKYAEPTRVVVTMEREGEVFMVTVADNGKGFDMEAASEKSNRKGGYGMGSLKERADLIRSFFPTKFGIKSSPGKGTRVTLEISLSRF